MKTFIAGFIVGIIVSTVGFSGIFKMLDKSVDSLKTQSHKLSKD